MKPGSLSLTARLAILFATLAAVLLMTVGVLLERSVAAHFDELDHHELLSKLAAIEALFARTTTDEAFAVLPQRLDDALAGHDTVALRVHDARGQLIHAVQPERFGTQARVADTHAYDLKWVDAGRHFIGREQSIRIPLPDPVDTTVMLGLDITHHVHFLTTMRQQLGMGISAATVLAALLGWLAAHKGLAPMRRVTATARRLSAERLGERLSEHDAPAEMRELVEAFNGMLERLEAAFRRLSDFSADIAHELRTPVSNLMTETQVALSRARGADEYRETLHSNLEEFDRLARMISDMLFLAKADNGLLPRPAKQVALDHEADALVEFYDALAEEQGVRLQVAGKATVTGDPLMLRRALANLISNAIRHTASGGVIDVRIEADDHRVALRVTNPGDAIPAEQLPRLFERFHRVDPSRTRQGEGSGLGLAITRSIVEAHGGTVTVESAPGRTCFEITLPREQFSSRFSA